MSDSLQRSRSFSRGAQLSFVAPIYFRDPALFSHLCTPTTLCPLYHPSQQLETSCHPASPSLIPSPPRQSTR